MEDELKKCKKCGRLLPLYMFPKAKSCSSGLNPQCRDCISKSNKARYCSTNSNFAFDRIPWPFDDDKHEMDMDAIEEYAQEKRLLKEE